MLRIWYHLTLLVEGQSVCGIQWRWNFFNPRLSWRIHKHVPFPILKYSTENLARTEWSFFKHGMNCFGQVMCQRLSRPWVIKKVHSIFQKVFVPLLYYCSSERIMLIHRHKFGVDISRFKCFENEEPNNRTLFHCESQRPCIDLNFWYWVYSLYKRDESTKSNVNRRTSKDVYEYVIDSSRTRSGSEINHLRNEEWGQMNNYSLITLQILE
jgi:hypothetical protein